MKKCELCEIDFPEHLIWQVILGDRKIDDCCPICANEEINEVHRLPYGTPFRGEQAQHNFDEATRYLEDPHHYTWKEFDESIPVRH